MKLSIVVNDIHYIQGGLPCYKISNVGGKKVTLTPVGKEKFTAKNLLSKFILKEFPILK